jgi:hypothetical protein
MVVVLGLLTAVGCGGSEKAPPATGALNSGNAQQASAPAAASSGPVSSPASAAPKPPPTPSAEQIAKWAIPEHEPLQLLACSDGFGDPAVLGLALSPDGKQFALGGAKLTLWKTGATEPTANLMENYKAEDVERPLPAVAISADGQWLAAGDQKGRVRVWTLADQKEVAKIDAHQGHIAELAFSPDSKLLATTSYSGEVTLWQLPEGKKLKSLKMSQQEIASLVFVSNTQLAFASNEASIWNIEKGEKETSLTTKRLNGPALGLSSDRRLLAFNDGDAGVQFWNVQESKLAGTPLRGASAQLIAFSSDGKRIATLSNRPEVRIWDAASGNTVQVIDADGDRTTALAWLPNANALMITSEYGRVRIWGTADAASAIGVQPLALPPLPSAAAERRSLSSAQLKQVIDIRSFPRLPGAVPQMGDFAMCSCTAPVSQPDAELFYRYLLGKAGWAELPPSPMSPGLIFQKDGCQLNVSIAPPYAGAPAGDTGLQISLQFAGNYDARWLPKLSADPKSVFESFSSAMYRTKGDLTDVEVALLKQFHAAGWTAYSRLDASSSEDPESRTISMLQSGSELTVSIGRPADAKDELMVQTSMRVSPKSVPIPPDAGWIEFDSSTDLQFVINTKLDLKQTVDFFDKQMAAEGGLAREAGRKIEDDKAWLPYLRGQQDIFLRLTTLPSGGTRIVAGDAHQSSWQLEKPKAEKSDKPGLEAADFALPAGATAVKFDVDSKQINFEVPSTTATKLGEQFAKQMESLDWKRDGAGIVGDDYTFITYKKDKAEVQIRARPAGKNATAMISGDGLLWTKPLSTAAVRISYETWLRRHRYNATLDRLDDFFAEMHKIPAGGK